MAACSLTTRTCWGGSFEPSPRYRTRTAYEVSLGEGLVDFAVSGQRLCTVYESGELDCLTPSEELERIATGVYTQPGGLVLYRFKHAWRAGTHAVVLDPLDLIARLVALIPPPHFHGPGQLRRVWRRLPGHRV